MYFVTILPPVHRALSEARGLHLRVEECGNPAPTQRPWKPRGQVVQGVYHPSPPEDAGDHIGAAPLKARGNTCDGGRSDAGERYIKGSGDWLTRHVWVKCRIEDRTEIRSQDGPLHRRPVPEEADGPYG
ncbi:unnamed protein product [Boreogadus saida]